MLSIHKKTLHIIRETSNHYLAAVKGNQPHLYSQITESFSPLDSYFEVSKGHGRIEKRTVEIGSVNHDDYPDWPDLNTIIRVHRQRSFTYHTEEETCYYISSLCEPASACCVADLAKPARSSYSWSLGCGKSCSLCQGCYFWRRSFSNSHWISS